MATEVSQGGGGDLSALPYRPCVGVVLTNADGLIFIAERVDMPGAWQMPQGGIDAGEEPKSAAIRELGEETGIGPELAEVVAEHPEWLKYDLPDALVGNVWKGRWRGQTQRWFLMRFHGDASDISLETDHREFSQWRWATPQEVIAGIVAFKRPIYERVLSHFGPFLGEHTSGN